MNQPPPPASWTNGSAQFHSTVVTDGARGCSTVSFQLPLVHKNAWRRPDPGVPARFALKTSNVKARRANGLGHERRHQMVNRQTRLHPRPDFRRGNPQRKTPERPSAKRWRKMCRGSTRPWNGNEFRQPGQFAGVAPFIKLGGIVGADEIKQLGTRKTSCAAPQRVNRIGASAAADLRQLPQGRRSVLERSAP